MNPDIIRAAQESFYGYRDENTGWGVPKDARFRVRERLAYTVSSIVLEWEHYCGGFGKRPQIMSQRTDVAEHQYGVDLDEIIRLQAQIMARQCIMSYILWAGSPKPQR